MNFFETFPECSLPSSVSKNTIKMVGRQARLRDVTDGPILPNLCLYTRANHAREVIRQWKHIRYEVSSIWNNIHLMYGPEGNS